MFRFKYKWVNSLRDDFIKPLIVLRIVAFGERYFDDAIVTTDDENHIVHNFNTEITTLVRHLRYDTPFVGFRIKFFARFQSNCPVEATHNV